MTPKQEKFAEEYVRTGNATMSAVHAGYSKATASAIGFENLRKPEIRDRIAALSTDRQEQAMVDSIWLLRRLADEATADLADLHDENGAIKPIHEWPMIWRQGLVSGIEVQEEYEGEGDERRASGRTVKLKLSDRLKRLELIGKHVNIGAWQQAPENHLHLHQGDGGDIDPRKGAMAVLELLRQVALKDSGTKSDIEAEAKSSG